MFDEIFVMTIVVYCLKSDFHLVMDAFVGKGKGQEDQGEKGPEENHLRLIK